MESEKNQVNVAIQATSKKLDNIDSGTPKQTTKSLGTVKNVDDSHNDGFVWRDKWEDFQLQYQFPKTVISEAKLKQMMNELHGILDETTDLLGGADEDEDSDSDYHYVLRDHHKGIIKDDIVPDVDDDDADDTFNDAIGTPDSQNDNVSGREILTETEMFCTTATKSRSERKRNELNELTESVMIVFMLISLYFLLSNMV